MTVWSAPNYCYRMGNLASFMSLDENLTRTWKMFASAPETSNSVGIQKTLPYFL